MADRPRGEMDSGSLRRASLTVAITLVGVAATLWLLFQLRGLLYMIFVSLFIAVALEPAVQFLDRRGWRRGLATGAVLLVTTLLILGLLASVVPAVVAQAADLISSVPEYIAAIEDQLDRWLDISLLDPEAEREFSGLGDLLQQVGSGVAGGILGIGSTVVGVIFQAFTIALFTFYMVAEGPKLRRTVLSFLPADRQREALRIWEIAVDKTGGYVYSRVILAFVAGAFTIGLLLVIGVDYALAMGIWVGVLSQFLPVVGTYVGAALPVLVALADDFWKAVWVLVGLVAYQQLENLVIAPKVTSKTMAIHPAVSVGAIIVGGTLMGATGVVLALPVAAIIQAVISTTIDRHQVIAEAEDVTDDPGSGSTPLADRDHSGE
ncbi:MAG: AI-2E family transporter [Actinomycetes bacterium]|nr:AI-2E family transporter [Acidimicrobiia bacterium]